MEPNIDRLALLTPAPQTLQRYGLTLSEWEAMAARGGYRCECCGKLPASGRLYVDHEHAKGWKRMPSEQRKLYVRGLACYVCNRFVLNYRVSSTLLRQAADYLDRYAVRRAGGEG